MRESLWENKYLQAVFTLLLGSLRCDMVCVYGGGELPQRVDGGPAL